MKVIQGLLFLLFISGAYFFFRSSDEAQRLGFEHSELKVPKRRDRGADLSSGETRHEIPATIAKGQDQVARLTAGSDFSTIWDQFEQGFENRSERYLLMTSLISKMSSLGMTDEAVALVKEKSGPGSFQSSLIGAAFAAAHIRSPKAYRDLLEDCQIKTVENHSAALMRIASSLGRENLSSEEVVSYGVLCEGESSDFFSSLLRTKLSGHFRGEGSAESCLSGAVEIISELQENELIEAATIGDILAGAPVSAFERVEALRSLGLNIDTIKNRKEFALSLVRESPERTMNLLSESNDPEMIDAAMNHWVKQDPFEANDWLNNRRDQMSEEFYQNIIPSFIRLSVEKRDYEAGRSWVGEVADLESQKEFLEEINKLENEDK